MFLVNCLKGKINTNNCEVTAMIISDCGQSLLWPVHCVDPASQYSFLLVHYRTSRRHWGFSLVVSGVAVYLMRTLFFIQLFAKDKIISCLSDILNEFFFFLLLSTSVHWDVFCLLADVTGLTVLNKLVSRPCVDFKCPETAINSGLIKAESFRVVNLF